MAQLSSSSQSSTAKLLRVEEYRAIEKWCNDAISEGRDFLFDPMLFHGKLHDASVSFRFSLESLYSLFRNKHLVHVKRTTHSIKASAEQYAARYTSGDSIVSLSRINNFPPYLFARILVETVAADPRMHGKKLTEAMRNLTLLGSRDVIAPAYQKSENVERRDQHYVTRPRYLASGLTRSSDTTTRLAREVLEAIDADPMYGPRHDKARNEIGIEHEYILEQVLKARDIPFETEGQLRERGTSRTPDVLLSCPLGVRRRKRHGMGEEWAVVCWIDSKALFGDKNTHETSVLPQAESYVHRFGPGMVLYWFGHAPLSLLDDGHGDITIIEWQLPEQLLLPTGELV